jgi:aspartate 1-decarboxylase
MKVNGAAARLVHHGDTIIVISYAGYDPDDLEHYQPRVVHVDAHNQIINVDREVASLLASATTDSSNGAAHGLAGGAHSA